MEVYERIIAESFQLFIRSGIKNITMDDIARNMGISKRTIYENFRDKDDLIKAVMLNHKNEQNLKIKSILATSSNVLDAIFKVMHDVMSRINQINPSFFTDLKKYHHRTCEELMPRQENELMKMLDGLINRGISDGIFREDIHVGIVTRTLNLQFKAISDEQLFPTGEFSKSEIFSAIIVNFARGIATPKGVGIIEELIETRKNNK